MDLKLKTTNGFENMRTLHVQNISIEVDRE